MCPDRPILVWCLNTSGNKHVISFGGFGHEPKLFISLGECSRKIINLAAQQQIELQRVLVNKNILEFEN